MRKVFVILAAAVLMSSSDVLAQPIDPDPDMIGFYFDEDATIYCTSAPTGAPFPAYLCLTNCTAPAGVSGWECSVWVTPGIFVLSWNLHGIAVVTGIPPDFLVSLGEPLPWAPSIVLMDVLVGVFAPGTIELKVYPSSSASLPPNSDGCFLPAYAAGDDPGHLRPLGYSCGYNPDTCEPNMCTVINGDCTPIENDEMTWGGVKALYK